ncbi:hypothetical protein CFI10_15550 [Marinobacterium iners]|jgi:uncharacterized phage-associated protein|uniref:Panacea domain-containing protein n=1 Tax=Marinobacterium iners TaxID=48076 RepID=UPI001A8EC7B1|nr:Panacea domain-containing protein [Marinobacterium iners]QSR36371.1 hypothetical protein CFI10_15550 [Marinobacterium iners]
MFDDKKVAQMAMYFLGRRGGRMSYLKLMKLLYLADRHSMELYDFPISDDHHVSLPHGPVLSNTLNLITGQVESVAWNSEIAAEANYEVSLKSTFDRDKLDELSDADIEVMEAIWNQFGEMNRWELRQHTHDHCPEWEDPNGSSFPISPEAIYRAVGRDEHSAQQLNNELMQRKSLEMIRRNYR